MKPFYCEDEHGNPVYMHREDPTRKYPNYEPQLSDEEIFYRVFGGAILAMVVLLLLLGWLL